MAEVFGIIASAVTTAALFTSCARCFEYIHLSRHFDRDFQTSLLRLSCARLRLTRWGESVNIYHDPGFEFVNETSSNKQLVTATLLQILVLFESTSKVLAKHKIDRNSAQDYAVFRLEDMDSPHRQVYSKLTWLAAHRQKGATLVKRAIWVLHDEAELDKLINGTMNLIESLEKITTPIGATSPLQLAKAEAKQFQDRNALAILEKAADQVDPLLQGCLRLALCSGHQYSGSVVKDQAKALMGDSFFCGLEMGINWPISHLPWDSGGGQFKDATWEYVWRQRCF